MLKFYQCFSTTYNQNKRIDERSSGYLLCEEKECPLDGNIFLTWENIQEWYKKHGLKCCFNIWDFSKGRVVSFFNFKLFNKKTWDIKEWKSDLKIEVKWRYIEIKPSIDFISKWPDQKHAIQYLKERGINIC